MSRDDRSLRDLLRRHDPAAGSEGLEAVERARIRQAVVEASRAAPARPFLPRPAVLGAVAAAVVAVVLGVAVYRQATRTGSRPDTESAGLPVAASGETARVSRQVQIATPGGTRIVWILRSDFEL